MSAVLNFKLLPPCRGKVGLGVGVWRNDSTLTLALSLQGRGDEWVAQQESYLS